MARMLGMVESLQFAEAGTEAPEQTLLRVGKFKHPKYGTINITPDHMRSFVKNHEAKVRRVEDAVDFGHNTGGPAAAWMQGVRFDEKSCKLLFKPQWTPKGIEAVKGQEYKYLSADFDLDYEDNESGKKFGPTLNGAGLTNRPFVKGMEAIQLSEGDCMNLEQALAMIEQLKAQIAQLQQGQQDMSALQAKFSEAETELKTFREKEAERAKADALAAKSKQFDELMKSGKACEAQRSIFLAETFDAVKFAEAFVPPHTERLSEEEKAAAAKAEAEKGATAESKILKLAETMVGEKKAATKGQAITIILSDPAHKALADEYTKNVQL